MGDMESEGQAMTQPCVDECIYRLRCALSRGRITPDDKFGWGFTLSILKHGKRPGWQPSKKQLQCMRRLVAETSATDDALIDRGDDG